MGRHRVVVMYFRIPCVLFWISLVVGALYLLGFAVVRCRVLCSVIVRGRRRSCQRSCTAKASLAVSEETLECEVMCQVLTAVSSVFIVARLRVIRLPEIFPPEGKRVRVALSRLDVIHCRRKGVV